MSYEGVSPNYHIRCLCLDRPHEPPRYGALFPATNSESGVFCGIGAVNLGHIPPPFETDEIISLSFVSWYRTLEARHVTRATKEAQPFSSDVPQLGSSRPLPKSWIYCKIQLLRDDNFLWSRYI